MTCYSVEPRVQKFVKGYGILSFAENTARILAKTFDHAKQSATDALKTASKKSIQNSRSNW